MPFYGLSTSSAATRPVQRTFSPYQPQGGSSGGYQPRGFPERIDLNNVGGHNIVGEAIGAAAKAPAYIYERPLAVIDALTGGNKATGQKGVIEQGIDTLKGVPVLGDLVRGAGNVVDGSMKFFPSILNSVPANVLKDTAHLPASAPLDPFQKLFLWDNTVGDFRKRMLGRGFTQQDIADLANGKKGTYDFGGTNAEGKPYDIADNQIVDLAGRLVLDPLNAALIFGPGRVIGGVQKAAQGFDRLERAGAATDRLLKLADARAIVAASTVMSKPALGVRAGLAALKSGVVEGATHQSLGLMLMEMGRGGAAFVKPYRNLALGTTAAQVGFNLVGDALYDNSAHPGPLNDLWDLGRQIQNDTPLSDSSLFSLWAVMHFPAREMIGQVTNAAKTTYRLHIPTGRDIETRLVDLLEPGPREQYAARLATMQDRFGGVESYLDFLRHIHGKWIVETPGKVTGGLAAAIAERPVISGMVSAAQHGQMLNELVDASIKYDPISGRDFVDTVKRYATGARNIKMFAKGLEQTFNPDTVYHTWSGWRAQATPMSILTGGAVVPQIRAFAIKEHLDIAKWRFRKAAKDGKVSPTDAQQIVNDYPSLWGDEETGAWWSKVTAARDAEAMPVGSYIQRLNKVQRRSPRLVDVLAPESEWAKQAAREAEFRKGFIGEDGKPNLDLMPTDGNSRVMTPTAANVNRANAGFPAETLDEVYAARSDNWLDTTGAYEDIQRSGYDVRMVKQGVAAERGALAPAAEITTGPIGRQGLAEVAARFLGYGKADGHARTVIAGADLDAAGIAANGVEIMWQVGAHSEAQKQQVMEHLGRLFGDVFVDDTAGVYRIYIPDHQLAPSMSRMEALNTGMGAIFPDKAPTGVYEGNAQRVFTETIRDTNRSKRGQAARAAGTERSVRNVADVARASKYSSNWHVSGNLLSERRKVSERGGSPGVASQLGQDNGPVREPVAPDGTLVGASYQGPGGLGGQTPLDTTLQGVPEGVGTGTPIRQGVQVPPAPADASALKGQLQYMLDRDAEVEAFHPNLGTVAEDGKTMIESSFSPEDAHKLDALAEQMTRYDPTYTMSRGPKDATPFRVGQGKAYQETALAKQITGDLISTVVTSKAANFWNALTGRVYTRDLANDAKQELFSDFLTAGASPGQVNRYMQALTDYAKNSRLAGDHVQLWHRMDLVPSHVMDDIAANGYRGFDGFDKAILDRMGTKPSKSFIRASSRFYRALEKNHRAVDGNGTLQNLIDLAYGPATKMANGKVGSAGNMIRALYPLVRFKLDPRWHLMNRFEQDVILAARWGRRVGHDARDTRSIAQMKGVDAEGILSGDDMASGWLDQRRLDAYIGPAFHEERVNSIRDALTNLAENDPIMVMLRRRVGKPGATADDLVNELDKMMYDFDSKGVESTILDEVEAQRQIDNIDYNTPEFKPMLQRLTKLHKQAYQDVVHAFHGNVNRSNIERLMNSYFLYWPISYQLKVAKVLVDVLTKSFGGRQTDLLGAWTYDRMMTEHKDRLIHDPEYAAMFEQHPELWRAAGMFLPITPEDVGVSASRIGRYSASALGAYMGLWQKDEAYPDLTSPMGMLDAGSRISNLGIPYTVDLLGRVANEFKDK